MSQMIKLPQQEMSVEALKALIAEAEAPQPVEGQVYRLRLFKDDPDAVSRRYFNGQWEIFDLHTGKWVEHDSACHWPNDLVPYTPPPPTFQVGQWVARVAGGRLLKVTDAHCGGFSCVTSKGEYAGFFQPSELRLATPEEIAAATRIQPKVGMLIEWQAKPYLVTAVTKRGVDMLRLDKRDESERAYCPLDMFSAEEYKILSRYTIEGAEP